MACDGEGEAREGKKGRKREKRGREEREGGRVEKSVASLFLLPSRRDSHSSFLFFTYANVQRRVFVVVVDTVIACQVVALRAWLGTSHNA